RSTGDESFRPALFRNHEHARRQRSADGAIQLLRFARALQGLLVGILVSDMTLNRIPDKIGMFLVRDAMDVAGNEARGVDLQFVDQAVPPAHARTPAAFQQAVVVAPL